MIPNVSSKLFTLSAIIVGYILIDDATSNEQNAMGNWLMLVAQVLCTNAYYKQVMQERGLDNRQTPPTSNNKETEIKRSNKSTKSNEKEETIEMLEKLIKAVKEEVNNLKKDL